MNNKKIKNDNSKTVQSDFANFNYVVVPSPLNGFKEVRVMFTYLGKPITRHLFIEENGNKNNDYYIAEAKKRINKEIKDGTLLKFSKHFTKGGKKTSKASKVALALTSVVALGLAGFCVYQFVFNVDNRLTITIDPNGGKFNDEGHTSGVKKVKVQPKSTWKELNTKIAINPYGASWEGWTYSIEGEDTWTNIGREDDITFTKNTTVKANFDLEGNVMMVTVDNAGGKWDPALGYNFDIITKKYEKGTTWGEIKGDFKIVEAPEDMEINTSRLYEYFDTTTKEWKSLGDGVSLIDLGENVLIHARYDDIMHELTINDPFEGLEDGTVPEAPEIKQKESWSEYRKSLPTEDIIENCKDGFEFAGYYMKSDVGQYIEIPEDYKFNSNDNIYLLYNVTINFVNEEERGILPHSSAKILTGTAWSEVKGQYIPTLEEDGDYEFTNFTDGTSEVEDTTPITTPTTFTAHYKIKDASSFTTDSWVIFLNELDKYNTAEELGAEGNPYYDDYISTEGKAANTFVGLTRSLEVGDKTYTVRVVDEHDRTTVSNNSLFTFEFTSALEVDSKYNNDSNYYDDSALSQYLDIDVFNLLPNEVRDAIKTKKVKYYKHNDVDPTQGDVVETTNEVKLYPLSAYEMGFDNYPADESGTVTTVKYEGEGALGYYQGEELATKRQKKRVGGDANVSYWLRSADIVNPDSVWFVNGNGSMGEHDEELEIYCSANYQNSLAVAPAFEI